MLGTLTATLTRYPGGAGGAVVRIDAELCRTANGLLTVNYVLEGDLSRLRIPPPRPPRFADRLWQHTCFEIFIRRGGLPGYHELNFSPSNEWAAYTFERYRHGHPLVDESLDPHIEVRSTQARLELEASFPLQSLSEVYADAPLSVGLSAVIEDAGGALSYWALAHPAEKPDFHHPDAFVLKLQ